MPHSRRTFLHDASAMGLLSLFLSQTEIASATTPDGPGQPTAGQNYWSQLYAGGSHTSRGKATKPPNEDRDPRFLHYDAKSGLRWAEDIKTDELPNFDEDAVVTLEMGGFRPGSLDTSKLAKVRYAQMHLSCQRVTGSEFIGPLVWAAMATVFADKAAKLPTIKDLNFASAGANQTMPGAPQLNRVLLSDGAGHLSVNITTTPTTSLLDKILSTTIQATRILTPLLGFPAISLPALQAFYTFYGTIEKANPENFLLNTSIKDVAVTRKGSDSSLISASSLKLVSGDYIMVPKSQEADFTKSMEQLQVQNGYLVERNAAANIPPDERVKQAVPDVSYITLSVKVQPASKYTSATTVTDPVLDAPAQGADSSATPPAKSKPAKPK